jgi:phospholipid transport system substrate-binding protein
MMIDRRDLLGRVAISLAIGAAAGLTPSFSHALTEQEAAAYIEATIEEVAALVDSPGDAASKASRLREIMRRRAAMPEIARFVAGISWRSMSEDQQERFTAAFSKFISNVYAQRFQQYSGKTTAAEAFQMGRVIDAGRKGLLVQSSVVRPDEAPIAVDWLVTDRPGRTVVADIVIEGVSMLVTEREEIGSMLEARGGDVEKLIADLAA